MIITKDYVLLNFPKTGSTFVRETLKELYYRRGGLVNKLALATGLDKWQPMQKALTAESRLETFLVKRNIKANNHFEELWLPIAYDAQYISGVTEKRKYIHGIFSQIPIEHRQKPILGIIRNPYDRVVSMYEYRAWARFPYDNTGALRAEYPHFPDLNFEEYFDMATKYGLRSLTKHKTVKADVGMQTLSFIKFYFENPDEIFEKLTDEYIDSKEFMNDLPKNITFLHTENLNQELYDFLRKHNHSEKELRFILENAKINVTNSRKKKEWETYFSPEMKAKIRHRDRMWFMLFPEYDE